MADLSQIKVGNVVYDIKDTYARENAGGASLDFKTSYMHVFEYLCESSIYETVLIYVPMNTQELQGSGFLSGHVDGIFPYAYALGLKGAFCVVTPNPSDSCYVNSIVPTMANLEIVENVVAYPDPGDYCLGVSVYSGICRIEEMTLVSEKVI